MIPRASDNLFETKQFSDPSKCWFWERLEIARKKKKSKTRAAKYRLTKSRSVNVSTWSLFYWSLSANVSQLSRSFFIFFFFVHSKWEWWVLSMGLPGCRFCGVARKIHTNKSTVPVPSIMARCFDLFWRSRGVPSWDGPTTSGVGLEWHTLVELTRLFADTNLCGNTRLTDV